MKYDKIMEWARITTQENVSEENDKWLYITPIDQEEITREQILDVIALDKSFSILFADGEDFFFSVRLL